MNTSGNKRNFPLIAFSVLVIVTLACGSSTPTSQPKVSTATSEKQVIEAPTETKSPTTAVNTAVPVDTPTPPATDTPMPELYLGDAVYKDGYALTAVSVQDPATPGILYTATSDKKLIAVEVIISNVSGDMITVNPLNSTLVDDEGFVYQSELGGVDSQIATLDLNPGEKVRGLIAYEVPNNAVAASLKYDIDTFGSKTLQSSLKPAPEGHVAIAEPPSTPGEPLPKLGDVVENFGYSLSATAVKDPAEPGILYSPKEGYKLVAVEIVLGNVSGSQVLSINPLYAFLIDNNGFVYQAELGGVDDQIGTGELAIGEKSKGWVAFTIPENSSPTGFKYSTELFSNNYLYSGLSK